MKKILAVRLSSLGDIILTQPILEQIDREGYKVDLFVYPDYAALGKMLPGVDRVITSLADLAPGYDLVLDLHGTLRARRIIRAARTRQLIRYSKRALARRLLLRWQGRPWFWNSFAALSDQEQVTQWYAQAAQRAGFSRPGSWPRIECSEWARKAADQTLQTAGIKPGDRFGILAPGAKWKTKQWPIEYFSQAAEKLEQELELIPLFVGRREEYQMCEQAAYAAGGRAVSVAGVTNLPALAAVLTRAQVLLANDSGPVHLGLAAGCRVVTFFGPTVSQFGFAPVQHPRARVLAKALSCRPCSLHGGRTCPLKHHNCLRSISPQEAVAAVKELVRAVPERQHRG